MKHLNRTMLGFLFGIASLGAAGCDPQDEAELEVEAQGGNGKSDASQSEFDKPCLEMAQSLNECAAQGGGECEAEVASRCEDATPPSWCALVSDAGELPIDVCNQAMPEQNKQISHCVPKSEFTCRNSCQCTVWIGPDPTPTNGREDGTLFWEECYDFTNTFVGNYNYGFTGSGSCCLGANQGGHC